MIWNIGSANESLPDIKYIGGKAYNLLKLSLEGIQVPKGIVIGTEVFNKLSNQKKYSHENLEDKISSNIANILSQVISTNDKTIYAVRSSATVEDSKDKSFAGLFKTHLGVTRKNLEKSVANIYLSAHQKHLKHYDQTKIHMAVVIQELIPSTISGVAFGYDLVNNTSNNYYIESTFGLCEPLVSGIITPDTYIISKNNGKIISKEIGSKSKQYNFDGQDINITDYSQNKESLNPIHLEELRKTLIDVESCYSEPQDIEWTIDNENQIYILQSRPITTI